MDKEKISKSFNITELQAKDAPVENIEWEGHDVQTEAKPLMDTGKGKPIILRVFDFSLPANLPKRPSKQELIDFHKGKIKAFLWKDELVMIEELKLIYSKDYKHFRIFATCQPRAGSVVLEKPKLIQQIAHGS